MNEKLKPCPFCGGTEIPHLLETPLEDGAHCRKWTLVCPECHAASPEYIAPSPVREKLIAAWDTRRTEESLNTELELLRQAATALLLRHSPYENNGRCLCCGGEYNHSYPCPLEVALRWKSRHAKAKDAI